MSDPGDRAVAITGANGYVGSTLSAAFAAAGYRVVVLQRSAPAPGGTRTTCPTPSRMDLRPRCLTTWPRSSTAPTTCVPATAPRSNESTSAALEKLIQAVGDVPIVFISSMSAYSGTQQIYGRTKIACEELVAAHGGTSLRLGLVYGEGDGGMIGALAQGGRAPSGAYAASGLLPVRRPRRRHGAVCGRNCRAGSAAPCCRRGPPAPGAVQRDHPVTYGRPQRRNRFVPSR